MNDWNIQSRAHVCQTCQKAFADKEHYHTLLFDQKSELVRQDICMKCWQEQLNLGGEVRKGFISHWQGIYEAPPATPPDPIQKENAETLMRKLMQLNDPKYAPALYILSAMLERKRLLKVKEQIRREGRRVFIYEHPRTGDIFMVLDPDLQLDQLEQVQHDVSALLEHGLPPTVEIPAPPEIVQPEAVAPDDAPLAASGIANTEEAVVTETDEANVEEVDGGLAAGEPDSEVGDPEPPKSHDLK